jgi:hypothetical protein
MQARMDKISVEAGLNFAQEREAKDSKNRKVFDEYKGGFLNFGQDIDGLELSATTIDYSGLTKDKKITAKPVPGITYIGQESDDLEAEFSGGGFKPVIKPKYKETWGENEDGDESYKGVKYTEAAPIVNQKPPPESTKYSNPQEEYRLPVEEDTNIQGVLGGTP